MNERLLSYDLWDRVLGALNVSDQDLWNELFNVPVISPAAQLIADYRKEHGAEIEETIGEVKSTSLPDLLDYASIYLTLIEKHLAAERARIEGEAS